MLHTIDISCAEGPQEGGLRVAGPRKPPPLGGVTGVLVWEAAIWEAAKVRVQAKLLYWKQHNNFAPGKGKALKRCPEPVHTASPEPKECVVPPVLAPGASADGGAARARLQDTCCAARARSRNECGWGSSVRQSHPYKAFPLTGLT